MAEGLRTLVEEYDAIRSFHLGQPGFWSAGSPADIDATGALIPRIVDALGAVNMTMAVALDSADHLATIGKDASEGNPTSVWSPVSIARSAIETMSTPYWL